MFKLRLILIIALALIVFSILPHPVLAVGDAWPMYGHDPAHTARSASNGPNSDDLKWTYKADGAISDPLIATDGTIFFTVWRNFYVTSAVALNPDGSLKWQQPSSSSEYRNPAIGTNGNLYLISVAESGDDYLLALDPATGSQVWNFDIGQSHVIGTDYSHPIVGSDGTIYLASALGKAGYGTVFAVNPNGTQKWAWDTNTSPISCGTPNLIYCSIESTVALAPNGNLQFKSYSPGLIALNSATGAFIWNTNPDTGDPFDQTFTIATDNTAYTTEGYGRHNFLAINPDGSVKWTTHLDNWNDYAMSALSADEASLYRGDNAGTFYSIIAANGVIRWRFDTGIPGAAFDGTPVLAANGILYFTISATSGTPDGSHGYVYAVRADSGVLVWQHEIGFPGADLAMGSDGTLLVPGDSPDQLGTGSFQTLYAFRCADGTCALPPQDPVAPSQLTATDISQTQVNLTWSDNSGGETAFKIERSPDGVNGWGEIGSVGFNQTSYSSTLLTCNTTYYYRVRAYSSNDDRYSSYSNIASATTGTCAPANDDIDNAYAIPSLPYNTSQDTTLATLAADDPELCGAFEPQGYNSVWYQYTPTQDASITVSTVGSFPFETTAIWTGTRGALVSQNCVSSQPTEPLTISVTAGTTYYIEVAGYYSGSVGTLNLSVAFVAPTITSFTPSSGKVGSSVTIHGTNLTGTTAVQFNGTSASTFNVVSAASITATVPAGATTGTISVTTPGGTATSSGNFTVIPVPTITTFTPTSGPIGTSVTIGGTHFTGATAVQFNGTSATTFNVVSATSITATVPVGATTGTVSVTTAGGTATSSDTFTVVPTPTIMSFTPTSGPAGTSVTISGTNFTGATAVKFNGTSDSTFNIVDATSISATVPAGATTGKISLTTPGGTATSSGSFTVIPTPTITTFMPTSGPVGTSVTISGTNFTGATAVQFNSISSSSFHVNSATSINATVPAGATTGSISVTTPGGTATSSGSFTVIPVPTITSFTPTSGRYGVSVTISGTNFTGATVVKFNGTNAGTFNVDSATSISATVPVGATTGSISVTTPTGTATSSTLFTVITDPPNAAPPLNDFTMDRPTLTWNAVSGATGYEIEVSTDKNFHISPAFHDASIPSGQLYAQTSSLTKGVYYWHVRAIKADGTPGTWSAVQSFTIDIP